MTIGRLLGLLLARTGEHRAESGRAALNRETSRSYRRVPGKNHTLVCDKWNERPDRLIDAEEVGPHVSTAAK